MIKKVVTAKDDELAAMSAKIARLKAEKSA